MQDEESQSQLQGASLVVSERQRIASSLQRSLDLEHQLSDLGKSNEEKSAVLRSHLCEVLSDVIISDPASGLEHDCMGKLWRNCFYAPIVVWRKKLGKEKKKPGQKSVILEQNFKKFLGEAITLYEYLVIQYQSMLIPSQSQGTSFGPSQDSLTVACPATSADGVVPGLFRLFINIGDLHRYLDLFSKAEKYYANASRLAPGMGSPYNQLAVVSQLKDPQLSCVSLYWYCRSLMATHDSFQTSTANLRRLFDLNSSYLKEHSRESLPPVLSAGKKKISSEMQRAQKTMATKAFLAHFVDLNYGFFKLPVADESDLKRKSGAILKSFESLLQASAFGDSLLVKMVTICTFSVVRNRDVPSNEPIKLLCQLGVTMMDKIIKSIEHSSKNGTIRHLFPVQLLLHFLSREEAMVRAPCTLNNSLWENVAILATSIKRLCGVNDGISQPMEKFVCKELQSLQGYKPYSFLWPEYISGDPFLSRDDAVDVLDLLPTQSHGSSKVVSSNDQVARFYGFLRVCDSCCQDQNVPILLRDGHYICTESQKNADQRQAQIIEGLGLLEVVKQSKLNAIERNEDDDEAGDTIFYLETDARNGNLGNQGMIGNNMKPRESCSDKQLDKQLEKSRRSPGQWKEKVQLGSASNVLVPPPGFEQQNNAASLLSHFASHSMQSEGLAENTSAMVRQVDGTKSSLKTKVCLPPFLPLATFSDFGEGLYSEVSQRMDFFGPSTVSNNPFISSDDMFANDDIDRQQPVLSAEESLLSSDLIESLWMHEASAGITNNPFAP